MEKKMKVEYPAGKESGIAFYDDVLSEEVCRDLVSMCAEDFSVLFGPGPTMGGVNPEIKNSYDWSFSAGTASAEGLDDYRVGRYGNIEHTIGQALWKCLAHYIESYETLWGATGWYDTGYRVQRYFKSSGYYRNHVDGEPWHHPTARRVFGVVIYLNTVEEGGETAFPMHGVSVPAVIGRIAVFPTTWLHLHRGNVSYSSDKWIISTFIEIPGPNGERLGDEFKQEDDEDESWVFPRPIKENKDDESL